MRKIVFLLMVLFVYIGMLPIHGAVIHVTTTADNAAGSLRAAITTANTNGEDDTIHLPAGTYVLTGASGEDGNAGGDLDIDTPDLLAITGDGAGVTVIDAGQVDRVLHIIGGTVSISGVTIQNGLSPKTEHGGGICNNGTLTLGNCKIVHNATGSGGLCTPNYCNGGDGGGIYNTGVLTADNCEIGNNTTGSIYFDANGGNGGGLYNGNTANITNCCIGNNTAGDGGGLLSGDHHGGNGGGIYTSGDMTVKNCTVSGNKSGDGHENILGDDEYMGNAGNGGGIFMARDAGTTIINCTIYNNSCGYGTDNGSDGSGGGIYSSDASASQPEFIKNTIIAHNQVGPEGEGPDCAGPLNSHGYNLIRDTGGCFVVGVFTGLITGVDPLLGPLADNGGPTQTCALLPGSPAIDAGDGTGITTDQRGCPRPVDMPGIDNPGDGADIGAFELGSTTISGNISTNGSGLPGVTLTFSNNGGTADTDENGNYSHPVPDGWTGSVTPSKEDYSFTPETRDYTNVTSPQTGRDYTASPFSVSVTITNPQDGETVSGTVTISASASSSQARSNIQSISYVEFYIDDNLAGTDTAEPYEYTWDTTQYANGTHTIKVKTTNMADQVNEIEITVTVENLTPMSLSRTRLNFGAEVSGSVTGAQSFSISGGASLNWTAAGSDGRLHCTPASGTGSGLVTVSVDASQTAPGTYTGTVTVESPDADNSPQTLTVYLAVYGPGSTSSPFGSLDTPVDGSTVSSSVPVTGWVLDDIEVEDIKIYRGPVTGEGSGPVYIGDAAAVEGARPDIETGYPNHPLHYQAGWGYMMLTHFLPNQGNGVFTLHAVATDKEGNRVTLGTTTITCNNAGAVKPFGAIDTPTQGGTASGGRYINYGWVLTPRPNAIPTDGSTISVYVDGVSLGNPIYNLYREDIASLFPGYADSDGAVGYFAIDTTQYENGVHTISWIAADDAGNADGIGSRYFTIQNSHGARSMGHGKAGRTEDGGRKADGIPIDYFNPVGVVKGYRDGVRPRYVYPGNNGAVEVDIRETERVELHFTPAAGYRPLTPLPTGSTFDPGRGIFYWQPGPGFAGRYEFVFIRQTGTGEIMKKNVIFNINPKFGNTGSKKEESQNRREL